MELHHNCAVGGTMYAVYRKWGVPKLFRMADRGEWDAIPERARKYPKEASFIHKYAPQDGPLHRLLRPLHVPCPISFSYEEDPFYKNSTDILTEEEVIELEEKKKLMNDPVVAELLLDAVTAIVEANPVAASKPNTFGRTPLHLACMELTGPRAQAASYLIRHTPMTTIAIDCGGSTPLHFLLGNPINDIPEALISQYLKADPSALERHNRCGLTPLDVFVKSAANEDDARERRELLKKLAT